VEIYLNSTWIYYIHATASSFFTLKGLSLECLDLKCWILTKLLFVQKTTFQRLLQTLLVMFVSKDPLLNFTEKLNLIDFGCTNHTTPCKKSFEQKIRPMKLKIAILGARWDCRTNSTPMFKRVTKISFQNEMSHTPRLNLHQILAVCSNQWQVLWKFAFEKFH